MYGLLALQAVSRALAVMPMGHHLTTSPEGQGQKITEGEEPLAAHALPCTAFMSCRRAAYPLLRQGRAGPDMQGDRAWQASAGVGTTALPVCGSSGVAPKHR